MMLLGAQQSISGGLCLALARAEAAGCEAAQIRVKPPRRWETKPLTEDDAARFRAAAAETGIPVVAHASILLNLASPDPALRARSAAALAGELRRCEALGIRWLVVHPGSHMGAGEGAGLARAARTLREALAATEGLGAGVLLENAAGQGTALGWRFDHLARLLDGARGDGRLGVCLDTCHAFAAGYDLRAPDGVAAALAALGRAVGLGWLWAVHFNDSACALGSRRDRHARPGCGLVGLRGLRALAADARLAGVPGLLEYSNDLDEQREDLAALRGVR